MPILGIYASSMQPALSATLAFDSIQTVSVGSGGSATISFTSIPSTYKHLKILGIGRTTVASVNADDVYLQFNNDTGANYTYHRVLGTSGTPTAYGTSPTNQMTIASNAFPRGNSNASVYGVFEADILDYTNANIYKTVRSTGGTTISGGGIAITTGLWFGSTNAITTITITAEGSHTFAQYSHFALYGMKG